MKKVNWFIVGLAVVCACIEGSTYFVHENYTASQAVWCQCMCGDCRAKEKQGTKTNVCYTFRISTPSPSTNYFDRWDGTVTVPGQPCEHKWRGGCLMDGVCLVAHERPMQTCEICDTERYRPQSDEWERGEFVMYRKKLTHECGGQLVFNGTSKPAPYTEHDNFYNHVCDTCGVTNSVLNATWPQYKQEWRAL